MTAQSAMLAGQRAAERLMTSSCTILRPTPIVDEEGYDTTVDVPVYEGKCKVQSFEPYEQQATSAGSPVTVLRYSVHVPVSSGPFEVGDLVRVDGRRRDLRIVTPWDKTYATAQRLPVEEVSNSNA